MFTTTRYEFLRRAALGVAAFIFVLVLGLAATQEAVSAQAKDKEAIRKQAEQTLKQGDYADAVTLFEQYLTLMPKDNQARLGLSYAYLKQRLWGGAFDQAARVLESDRSSARARAIIGAAWLANGDFRGSAEAFRVALALDEREALAWAGAGLIDFYENRLSNSIDSLRHAVALAPNEPDFIFALAQASARKENFKEAADSFERFLQIAPKTDADRRARIRGLVEFLRYLGQQRGRLYQADGDKASLPLEMLTTRPVIPVRVNGSAPQKFVFDTGSGMCVLSEETARRLGVKAIAHGGQARAVGGNGRFEIIYGFLDKLEIGDVTIRNVPVYIRHFYAATTDASTSTVDGYLGTSAIAKYLTTVDYAKRTFALDTKRQSKKEAALIAELPIRSTSSGFLSGEVQLDGIEKPLNFIIDTGASISVLSDRLAGREELASLKEGLRMRVFGAAGVADDVRTLILPRVLLGEHSQHSINAAVLDLDSINETAGFEQTGILGGNFLYKYRVTFDFRKGILRLENPAGAGLPTTGPAASVAVK